ncbi:MAG: hypothetical protein H0V79_05260 [Actinobacteria bacterium]|nr:hypothetical protein [Actinomycetota bacterium]
MNRKLVVFVPREALDKVRTALFDAGAGRIGEYEHCSWYAAGTGTFLAGEGASPTIGERGREQRVSELRLETVFAEELQEEVVAALREAHPYEEPAYDIYQLL